MKGIITLCGSTKFKDTFNEVNMELTFNNYIVLSVGSFHHSDEQLKPRILSYKELLDKLHKDKIDLSQAIVVINVDNYIGESTKSEILHAIKRKKQIYWYNPDYITGKPDTLFLNEYFNRKSWTELLGDNP